MTEAYVLGGVRTPFTRYGGTLSGIRADDFLGMTMKGACDRLGVPLGAVEDIMAGCVNPAHEGRATSPGGQRWLPDFLTPPPGPP
jgi:acetyl-CoA acetyltransferase